MLWKNIELKVEQIYNDYGKLMLNVALKEVGDKDLAEEAVQETIIRLIHYPNKIKELEGNELKNYVVKVAKNTGRSLLKQTIENNAHEIADEELLLKEKDKSYNAEDYVITKDSINNLRKEIRKLDKKYSEPLVMHRLHKHTIAEVSDLLSVPERTVKYRINSAVKMLKAILKKGEYDNE